MPSWHTFLNIKFNSMTQLYAAALQGSYISNTFLIIHFQVEDQEGGKSTYVSVLRRKQSVSTGRVLNLTQYIHRNCRSSPRARAPHTSASTEHSFRPTNQTCKRSLHIREIPTECEIITTHSKEPAHIPRNQHNAFLSVAFVPPAHPKREQWPRQYPYLI